MHNFKRQHTIVLLKLNYCNSVNEVSLYF